MIDYIHEMCRHWGDARFFIDNGTSYPSSIFGRLDGGWSLALADPTQRPDPPEVMLGLALKVSIAIRKALEARELKEKEFRVLYIHYAERAPAKRKAYTLKISRKRYYELLHRCHRVLRRNLDSSSQRNQSDECQGDKILSPIAA